MARLTERERDERALKVAELSDMGLSQDEICERLNVSRGTVVRDLSDVREGLKWGVA